MSVTTISTAGVRSGTQLRSDAPVGGSTRIQITVRGRAAYLPFFPDHRVGRQRVDCIEKVPILEASAASRMWSRARSLLLIWQLAGRGAYEHQRTELRCVLPDIVSDSMWSGRRLVVVSPRVLVLDTRGLWEVARWCGTWVEC